MEEYSLIPLYILINTYRPGAEALHFQDRHGRGKLSSSFSFLASFSALLHFPGQRCVLSVACLPHPLESSCPCYACIFIRFPFQLTVLFLSSVPPTHPPSLPPSLTQVIKAWDEGVMTMKVGEKAIIKASPDYAYGAGGFAAWGRCLFRIFPLRFSTFFSSHERGTFYLLVLPSLPPSLPPSHQQASCPTLL